MFLQQKDAPPPPLFFFYFLAEMKEKLTITLETWNPMAELHDQMSERCRASPLGGSGLRSGSSLGGGGGAVMLLVLHSFKDKRF